MLDRIIFTAEAMICIAGVMLVAFSPLIAASIYRHYAFKHFDNSKEQYDRIDRRSIWIMGVGIFLTMALFCFCLAPVKG